MFEKLGMWEAGCEVLPALGLHDSVRIGSRKDECWHQQLRRRRGGSKARLRMAVVVAVEAAKGQWVVVVAVVAEEGEQEQQLESCMFVRLTGLKRKRRLTLSSDVDALLLLKACQLHPPSKSSAESCMLAKPCLNSSLTTSWLRWMEAMKP